ncbi:uncharacterized protein METZ01_LOCUS237891, partial [marine metagenome]
SATGRSKNGEELSFTKVETDAGHCFDGTKCF